MRHFPDIIFNYLTWLLDTYTIYIYKYYILYKLNIYYYRYYAYLKIVKKLI